MSLLPTQLPEGRAGQALAVLAPLCILLGFIFGVVQPALAWYGARQARLAAGQEQIAWILAEQSRLPQLRQQAQAATQTSGNGMLLPGGSNAIADANLQSDLGTLASQSGASLTSAEALPAQSAGPLKRVGIELDVTADWPALTDFLTAIETAKPRMIVDDLSISNSGAPGSAGGMLQASFSVLAFRSAGS